MYKSISIVIPVYNDAALLRPCLESIAAQKQPPDEVIVVDNNSTDGSAALAAGYPFARVIRAERQGIVYARDTGFDAAGSDIIARIDADSVLPPTWVGQVRRFYSYDSHTGHALTGGGYFYNVRWPRFNGWLQSQLVYRLNRFVVGHYVLWGSDMALPRPLWQAARASVCHRLDIHEDLDLSFHLHDAGYKITYRSSLRVGVFLKRVFGDRRHLKAHMRRWPQTLRVHGYRHWRMAILGNYFLWFVIQPLAWAVERGARLLGRPPLGR